MTYSERAERIKAISSVGLPVNAIMQVLMAYDKILSNHVAEGGYFDIPGIGKLETIVTEPRRYWHIKSKEHRYSVPNYKMRFTLYEKQQKKLKKRRWTRNREVTTSHILPIAV